MARTVTISLAVPLDGPRGPVHEIVLREPRFSEVLEHGEPFTVARSPEGVPLFIENPDAIRAYARLCVASPDPLVLAQAGVKIARQVKEAVFDFFLPEAAEGAGSTTSPTS